MRGTWIVGWAMLLLAVGNLSGSGDVRLVDAIKNRNTELVRALLKQGIDVNARQGDGATALHWAAYWDDQEVADLLIRAGIRVKTADDHGVTPLWLASLNGSAAMVEKLLDAGADPKAALVSGETPLMVASRTGSAAVVRTLLHHGANVNAKEASRGQTALMWAAAQQHPDVVQALVARGADVHARTRSYSELVSSGADRDEYGVFETVQGGFTPLLFVARNGDVASAKILLAAGANVNVAAAVGTTALVVAVHSGRVAIARLLLDNGADPNNAGAGYTALHIAVRRGDRELVRALLAHGANPNALLMQATPVRRQSIVDIGLHYSLIGATPFWMAARFADSEMMRLLAANGADPSFAKADGTTSVMAPVLAFTIPGVVGSESRRLEALKLALELGGDVNASNDAGDTALHGAAKLGYNGVVQFLVEKGAQLDRKNKSGRTPLAMTGPCHITPSSMRPIAGRPDAIACVERTSTAALLRKLGAIE